jgi:hypothetical protein
MFSLKVAAVCAGASPRFDQARGKGQEMFAFFVDFPAVKRKGNERKLWRRNEAIRVGQTREPAREKAEASLTLNVERSTSNIEHRMRILMISAEGPPLQRTGALIDVMGALPRELAQARAPSKRGTAVSP